MSRGYNTVVKTGVILEPRNNHRFGEYLHGDLHIVGNCAIIFYPIAQVPWGSSHGWIDLGNRFFDKDYPPFGTLVIPASCVYIRRSCLHEFDLGTFVTAGGQLIEIKGEMGSHKPDQTKPK